MKKLILGILLICNVAIADISFDKYIFSLQQLPGLCGPVEEVQRFADDNKFTPLNFSLGRSGGKADGEPVFIVTYWVNDDLTRTMATIAVPDGIESCIVFVSFDVIGSDEFFKGKNVKWREEHL